MSIAADSTRPPLEAARATVAVFVTLAGVSCGLTLLYLGMRAVMDVGGACASGGPYVPRVECPEGVPVLMIGGIWGGLVFVGLYLWATSKHRVPTLVAFAWPALFLSLGWNFLDYGIDPPGGEGLMWGWLVCAVLFAAMGGLPLLAMAGPVMKQFTSAGAQAGPTKVVIPTRSRVRELRATQRPDGFRPSEPAPPSGPAPGDEDPDSLVDALERLQALRRSGSLTAREFEDAKRRIIGGPG